MLIGHVVIQCRAVSGETGTFLAKFGGHPRWEPISPIFTSLADLYPWLDANGWTLRPYDQQVPTGAYEKDTP
ncbi:hypothetical protein [Roseococcus sp.]|uniref:hypothetical protein n=1 Tax=Roseococcus sp. TaxID=2109646 RepID=UPI003BAB9261